jgi:hypothetical protein
VASDQKWKGLLSTSTVLHLINSQVTRTENYFNTTRECLILVHSLDSLCNLKVPIAAVGIIGLAGKKLLEQQTPMLQYIKARCPAE